MFNLYQTTNLVFSYHKMFSIEMGKEYITSVMYLWMKAFYLELFQILISYYLPQQKLTRY